MKINDEVIEKIFEKWLKVQRTSLLHKYECEDEYEQIFKTAINMLLPIIEKQSEAIQWYIDRSWNLGDRKTVITECGIIPGTLVAKEAQKFMKEKLKELSDEYA